MTAFGINIGFVCNSMGIQCNLATAKIFFASGNQSMTVDDFSC